MFRDESSTVRRKYGDPLMTDNAIGQSIGSKASESNRGEGIICRKAEADSVRYPACSPTQPRRLLLNGKDSASVFVSNERAGWVRLSRINHQSQTTRSIAERRHRLIVDSTSHLVGGICKAGYWAPTSSNDLQENTGNDSTGNPASAWHCGVCQHFSFCIHLLQSQMGISILNTTDPFNCSLVPINFRNQDILRYFVTAWIPSGSPTGSNLAGFTIMGAQDNDLAFRILKGSLSTKVHILTLFAATANRMKYVSEMSVAHADAPELHAVRAIREFRKYIGTSEPVTSHVILDLFFLSLAEYYAKNHLGSRLHYQFMKRLVIILGGFANLEPFIAWLVLSADYLLAASSVTPPVFDFTRDSRLLGIPGSTTADQFDTVIPTSNFPIDPKMRLLIEDNILIANVVAHIRKLPALVQSRTKSLVGRYSATVHRLITMPLQVHGHQKAEQLVYARIADKLMSRCRHLSYIMWLWYSALSFVNEATQVVDANIPQVMTIMSNSAKDFRTCLERALSILQSTACAVHLDLLLWLSAVGILLSTGKDDMAFYRRTFARAANGMAVVDHEGLVNALNAHLPLAQISNVAVGSLYGLLVLERMP